MTSKQITFEDAMDIARDERVNARQRADHKRSGGVGLAGVVTMTDNTGRVCFRKRDNLIVLRGRTYALELLFHDPIAASGVNNGTVPYISDLTRLITPFQVGKGGAPSGDPFTPSAPPPTGAAGVALASPVPLRLHDTTQASGGNSAVWVSGADMPLYALGAAVPGNAAQTLLNAKNFVAAPTWNFSETNNTVYKEILMHISENDCRTSGNNQLNELCLLIAARAGTASLGFSNLANPEMFSRITFPTEFLAPSKTLDITYRIYA